MRKVVSILFVFSSLCAAAMSPCSLTWPDINNETTPKVVHVDVNLVDLVDCDNEDRDTIDNILAAMGGSTGAVGLSSTGDLKATIDRDSNTTGSRFWVANHTNDTLFRVSDDLAIKAYGAFTVVGSSTLAALSASTGSFSGALTGTTAVFSGAISSVSPAFTGAMTAANGTYSGTLVVTGLLTATAGLSVPDGAGLSSTITFARQMIARSGTTLAIGDQDGWTGANLKINSGNFDWYHNASNTMRLASSGLTVTGVVNASGDLSVTRSASGSGVVALVSNTSNTAGSDALIRAIAAGSSGGDPYSLYSVTGGSAVSAGIDNSDGDAYVLTFAATPGGATNSQRWTSTGSSVPGNFDIGGTGLTTGVHTFTAAPVLTALTASLPVFTNGSKAAVSNAMTGTGSVVMSTSPTLVTPALGAATATSLVASGNVTADSLISSKLYEENSFTATLTGVTGSITGTAYFVRVGKFVTLRLPTLIGTSNTTAMTITGMPTQIRPSVTVNCYVHMEVRDNSTDKLLSMFSIATSGVISPYFATSVTGFYGNLYTSSGTKGIGDGTRAGSIFYTLQ